MSTSLETAVPTKNVIGFPVTALKLDNQIGLILEWAKQRLSKFVCVANVHMLIEAHREPAFASILKRADLVTPDGMPLVWMLRLLGTPSQDRVAGMDILLALCERASAENIGVFFLGSQTAVLDRIRANLERDFPSLTISGMEPLPFRPLTEAEDAAVTQAINNSGAGVVLVCLGCPKQEIWMAAHRDRIKAVMIGLGGAFPVYAGIHKRAPLVVRSMGFEWLYRLAQEPARLWKRYSSTIPMFLWLALKQLLLSDKDISSHGLQ